MSGRIVHPNALESFLPGPATSYSDVYAPLGYSLGVSVDATVVVATGTLDVEVQWSPDGTNFGSADGTADSLTQFAAAGVGSKQVVVKAPFYRLKYVVATANVTFTAAVFG